MEVGWYWDRKFSLIELIYFFIYLSFSNVAQLVWCILVVVGMVRGEYVRHMLVTDQVGSRDMCGVWVQQGVEPAAPPVSIHHCHNTHTNYRLQVNKYGLIRGIKQDL